MAPATEIASIPLVAGADIKDGNSDAGKVWSSVIDTISQQDGYQRLSYGQTIEDPNQLILVVDWDDLESHQRFMQSTIYTPFLQNLSTIVDGDLDLRHAYFQPFPPTKAIGASSAPVTELLTAYLETKNEEYGKRSANFGRTLEAEAHGCTGVSTGFVEETVENEKAFGSGRKGHAYLSAIGWQSKDHHMAFRETEAFKNNIHLCREGCKALSAVHVSLTEK